MSPKDHQIGIRGKDEMCLGRVSASRISWLRYGKVFRIRRQGKDKRSMALG
jgi:hypothetical protein